jgi:hypothetical protein
LTKFICSLAIGISLLFIPVSANADEILIELTPEVAYVDTVVEVTGTTEYFIETFTGTRLEQQANGTVRVRDGWVDSWIELRQGETVLRADDDSNHQNGVNEYASKLTGTIDTGTYTIRATSYLNRVGYGNPTGNYTLTSNLIQPPPPPVVVEPEPTPPPVEEPVIDTTVPTVPDIVITEPPIIIPIPPEPPIEPPAVIEEPPAPAEEPPAVEEEPTPVVEEPPIEAEEPPTPVEEPPVEAEEPPAEEESEVVQLDEVDLETLAPETPVQLDNGVVLEAGTVVALQLLENPAELLAEIFTDPGQVLTALSNIGADMSEEEREESEKIIIASVIAGQAAVNAATMAAGTTTRTPSAPSAPAGGPMSGNDKPRASRRRES